MLIVVVYAGFGVVYWCLFHVCLVVALCLLIWLVVGLLLSVNSVDYLSFNVVCVHRLLCWLF